MNEDIYECLTCEHTACLCYNFSLSATEEDMDQANRLQAMMQENEDM